MSNLMDDLLNDSTAPIVHASYAVSLFLLVWDDLIQWLTVKCENSVKWGTGIEFYSMKVIDMCWIAMVIWFS